MVRVRVSTYWRRIQGELEAAFAEEHTPHEVAGSFSIGVFVTTLPSLGLGLVFFLALVRLTERVSKLAIFASALAINPLVKAPMYVAAFWIGGRMLGPMRAAPPGSVTEASAIAVRMMAGFFVLGVFVAVAGYLAVYLLVTEYRKRDLEVVEDVVDDDLLPE